MCYYPYAYSSAKDVRWTSYGLGEISYNCVVMRFQENFPSISISNAVRYIEKKFYKVEKNVNVISK